MASQLSTTQSVKQGARQLMSVASDKMKLASSAVARGDTRELDVAVIKSTTPQFHVVPKEKHVRTLKEIVQHGGKDHVREVIRELLQRLKGATDWLTALKCLMVVHRLMKECGTTFLNALVQHGNSHAAKGRGLLDMGNFLDSTTIDGRFDYSEWVRGYGRYLDEQLDVFRELAFYPETEAGGESRLRTLSPEQLLLQLPVLQRLQQRLMDCRPGGAAAHDPVVQAALLAVLKESFKVYKAISEGIINLADRFFEMEYLDALKGLEVYKESIVDNSRLQEYYREVEGIEELKRAVQFPRLEALPPDFLAQMEEYVREAPRPLAQAASAPTKRSSPLRKGSKTPAGRPPPRAESHASGGAPADRGMIGAVSKPAPSEGNGQAGTPTGAGGSGNLLELDDLSLGEPSPAPAAPSTAPPQGFGGAGVSYNSGVGYSSAAADPFAAAAPASPYQQLPSPYQQQPAPSQQQQPSGGANPFGPPTPTPAPAQQQQQQQRPPAQAASAGLPDAYGLPSGLPPTPPPSRGFGGPPMVASQQGEHARQPTQPGIFGAPPLSAFQAPAYPPPAAAAGFGGQPSFGSQGSYGGFSGLGPASSSLEAQASAASVRSQPGFGQAASGEPAGTPARSAPPPSHAIAAGLVRPTNVALAKEAALHDPFVSLAALAPKPAAPRQSPPLKSISPGSGVASHATSPGLAPQAAQTGLPLNGNGFSGFGGAGGGGLGPSAFGPPPHKQPQPQQQQQQAFESSSFPSGAGGTGSSSSLI